MEPAPKPSPAAGPAANKPEALKSLTRYIPTEIITLYVATLAARPALKTAVESWLGGFHPSAVFIYLFFVLATPAFFFLVYASARYQHNEKLPPRAEWPWWPMGASMLSFMAWGLSVPTNPILGNASAAAGLFSLVLSTILTRCDPIFDPSKRDPRSTA